MDDYREDDAYYQNVEQPFMDNYTNALYGNGEEYEYEED